MGAVVHVKSVELINFMKHKHTKFELPERGIVALTGINGSGKSSLIEAVSYARHGRTLRGKPPWRKNKTPGSVRVELYDGGSMTSKFTGKAIKSEVDNTKYDTAKKAAGAKRGVSWEVWARSSVFSSSDASLFTTATDGERKRLIDALRDLERFDPAANDCRKDLRQAFKALGEAERALDLREERASSLHERLTELEEEIIQARAAPEEATSAGEEERLEQRLAKLHRLKEKASREAVEAVEQNAEVSAKRKAIKTMIRTLGAGTCDACGQAIDASYAGTRVAELRERLDVLQPKDVPERSKYDEKIRRVERELGRLAADSVNTSDQLARLEKKIEEIRSRVEETDEEVRELESSLLECRRVAAVLQVAEKGLGLQGVRAGMMNETLVSIEAVTNMWLARMAAVGDQQLSIKLRAYTETARGSVQDKLDLEIEGAGDGYGYLAASAGERRRIDVAVLFALGELASGSEGLTGRTLFFDEVLDALDIDGVEAACSIINTLAESTNIVLISHDDRVLRRVKIARHYMIDGGAAHIA